jgi:hypothetical protein
MTLTLINQDEYNRRFQELSHLHALEIDNDKKVEYAMEVLEIVGQKFEVNPPKNKTLLRKNGSCYPNAIAKTFQGFQYVEGIIISLDDGYRISHAWNVDAEGNHIDFTKRNNYRYEYFGVIIPKDLWHDVGKLNGQVLYCTLPYITVG